MVLAFAGNVLIFVVIFTTKRLHTVDNTFIANLAISDFLFTLIETASNTTREINPNWQPPRDFVCYIILASSVLCASASVFTQTAVAVNRYIAVTRPLEYVNLVNGKRVGVAILLIWVCAIILASPPLIWRPLSVVCGNESYEENITWEIVYMAAEWLFIFVIPFGTMFVIYYRIYRVARSHANRVLPNLSTEDSTNDSTTANSSSRNATNLKRELKAAKMLVTIGGAFLLSWFPFFVTLTLWKFETHIRIDPKVFTVFLYFIYTVPAINPAIYAFWSREIRTGIIKRLAFWKQSS